MYPTNYYHRRRRRYRGSGWKDNSPILPCGFNVVQTYDALKKAWRGYEIAINKDEYDLSVKYASIIQKLQKQLGGSMTSFPWLRMHKAGEFDDLAHYIQGELTGEEPFAVDDEEKEAEEKSDEQGIRTEANPDYEFKWSAADYNKIIKRLR